MGGVLCSIFMVIPFMKKKAATQVQGQGDYLGLRAPSVMSEAMVA